MMAMADFGISKIFNFFFFRFEVECLVKVMGVAAL
jgi:hypothetical protein